MQSNADGRSVTQSKSALRLGKQPKVVILPEKQSEPSKGAMRCRSYHSNHAI